VDTLLGTKRGMTQLWTDEGDRVSVTVLDMTPNLVTALKTTEKDGYEAVQLGYGAIRDKRVAKPQLGSFKKSGVAARRHLREVRCPVEGRSVGEEIACSVFEAGQVVDVIGTSKGKGFQGTIKLHNFSRGPTSHGSQNIRKPGSIGMHTHPGRVLKGKRMASRMGGERVTAKNLAVVSVDPEAHVMLVRGPVPGNAGGLVLVRRSAVQPKPKQGKS
jgi:large subunit ribosomal protein L3